MDVNRIFDAVAAMGAASIKADKIDQLRRRIAEAKRKTCGHCFHWMKRSCKPEHEKGQFKSTSSLGCGDFDRTQWVFDFTKELESELVEASK